MAEPVRANLIVRSLAVKAERVIDTVTLDHQERYRRRAVLSCDSGLSVLLDLDKPMRVEDGDALKLEDGRLVRVIAAPEDLIEVASDNKTRLLRAAWHLGNRHTPAEITTEAIFFAHDHVLVEMLRGLGVSVKAVKRPFRPERGAYDGYVHNQAHGTHHALREAHHHHGYGHDTDGHDAGESR
jgi:urease accessory protein